ncbi:MAG: hypothetical protein ACYTF8_17935, partial [Planctomycetota bacterium]
MLLLGGATVAAVVILESGAPPERGGRKTAAEHAPRNTAATIEEPRTQATPSPTGNIETGTTENTETVTPEGDAEAKAAAPAGSRAKPGTVVINGKEYPIENLPEGFRILPRGGGAGSGEPTPVLGGGGGGRPGRFAPRPVPGKWSKWAPAPRFRGESTLAGRVLDAGKKPLEGATVYRIAAVLLLGGATVAAVVILESGAPPERGGRKTAAEHAPR